MKVSQNFVLQEFVNPDIYRAWGNRSIWFIDPRIIEVAQFIRTGLNVALTINNWHTGGQFQERGFRNPDTTTGGKLSQHKFGRAIDISATGKTPADILDFINENWDELKKLGLTTVENITATPTWLHCDCRWTGQDELLIVNP